MATKQGLREISLQSAADLSTKQFHFGTVNSSGQIAVAGTDGRTDGVIQGNVEVADRAVGVGINGVSLLAIGGTITAGGTVKSDSAGKGVAGATNSRAIALTSGVSGDIIEVLLN